MDFRNVYSTNVFHEANQETPEQIEAKKKEVSQKKTLALAYTKVFMDAFNRGSKTIMLEYGKKIRDNVEINYFIEALAQIDQSTSSDIGASIIRSIYKKYPYVDMYVSKYRDLYKTKLVHNKELEDGVAVKKLVSTDINNLVKVLESFKSSGPKEDYETWYENQCNVRINDIVGKNDISKYTLQSLKAAPELVGQALGKMNITENEAHVLINHIWMDKASRLELSRDINKIIVSYNKSAKEAARAKADETTAMNNTLSELYVTSRAKKTEELHNANLSKDEMKKYFLSEDYLIKINKILSEPEKLKDVLNPKEPMHFFANLDPNKKLDWIDDIFNTPRLEKVSIDADRLNFIKIIVDAEQNIINNAKRDASIETAESCWEKALTDLDELLKDYAEDCKNPSIIKLSKESHSFKASLKTAGGIISGLSLLLQGANYAFGALIPGGALYASYFSGLFKNGRRLGKIISNAGSPLESKNKYAAKIKRDKEESSSLFHKKHSLPKEKHEDDDLSDTDKLKNERTDIGKSDLSEDTPD